MDFNRHGGTHMKNQPGTKSKTQTAPGRDKEDELISRWKQGASKAFKDMYRHFQSYVLTIAMRVVNNPERSWDVMQEVFLKIHRYGDHFEEGTNFRAWIRRITINTSISALKKSKADALKNEEYDERLHRNQKTETYSVDTIPDAALENKELNSAIQAELDRLPPERKELIVLCDWEGLSYQEAADKTGTKIGTVMSRLFRARKEMIERLIKKLDEYPGHPG